MHIPMIMLIAFTYFLYPLCFINIFNVNTVVYKTVYNTAVSGIQSSSIIPTTSVTVPLPMSSAFHPPFPTLFH